MKSNKSIEMDVLSIGFTAYYLSKTLKLIFFQGLLLGTLLLKS